MSSTDCSDSFWRADHIIFACSILMKASGRSQIGVEDVAECEDLFLDARRSAALLSSEAGADYIS
jgi:RuvB-like protein 1